MYMKLSEGNTKFPCTTSIQITRMTERTCYCYVPVSSSVFFSNLKWKTNKPDCSVWHRILSRGKHILGKLLIFLWGDVSAPGKAERTCWPLFLCCLVPWGSGRITVRLFALTQPELYSHRLTGSWTFIQAEPLNQYTVSLICTPGRQNDENCEKWNSTEV